MSFTRVADPGSVWIGELTGVEVHGRHVLLVNVGGTIRAYADHCLHKGVLLSKLGTLEGTTLTCGAHEWRYDVTTGCGVNPKNICLKTYPVSEREDGIYVDVEAGPNG